MTGILRIMKIIEFSRESARKVFGLWKRSHELPVMNSDYALLRTDLTSMFNSIRDEVTDDRAEYTTDVLYGLKLYEYFGQKTWFNLRLAANDGFWRYIAVAVIPNIVGERWGDNRENYFWKQSNRLWPNTVWWFIHLTWHNSSEETKRILLQKHFDNNTFYYELVEQLYHL